MRPDDHVRRELQLEAPALSAAALVDASRRSPPFPLAAPLTCHPAIGQSCRFGPVRAYGVPLAASARIVIDMSTTAIASIRGTFTPTGGNLRRFRYLFDGLFEVPRKPPLIEPRLRRTRA